jgi:ribonuclease HI
MAMGAVFREHDGSCLLAASEPLQGFSSPEVAEALALRRAISIAREKDVQRVIFVSDCRFLILRLNSSAQDRSQVGSVVTDILKVASGFTSVVFQHVGRSINEAAHTLARSCNFSSSGFISDVAPECIRRTLCIDVM